MFLAHLQSRCTYFHSLNLLALYNEMQRYHLKVEGVPEYINMLEDAQKQAGHAGRTIFYETLLLFTSTAMPTPEQYTITNNDWEDRS